jgi:hypothetical protein
MIGECHNLGLKFKAGILSREDSFIVETYSEVDVVRLLAVTVDI